MNDPGFTLQPMVHVEEMAAAIDFYERLGGTLRVGDRGGDWALIELGGAEISLLAHPPNPEQADGIVELNFVAHVGLEEIAAGLREAGLAPVGPLDAPAFGRQLQVTTPDGLLLKINEFSR